MSPKTLRLDRTIPKVGRIARASGTTDLRTFKAMNRMIDSLYETGHLDVLRALVSGLYTPLLAFDAFRRHDLDSLPTAATMDNLASRMEAWVEKLTDAKATPEHRRGLKFAAQRIKRAAPRARVHDAPDALLKVRAQYEKQPRAFNLTRAALQAYLRDTLTRAHPIYAKVAAVETLTVKPTRAKRPQAIAAMRAKFPAPESDVVDAIAWAMATTGMGPGEFWGAWDVLADRIAIHGTKRGGRERVVPLVRVIARPPISRKAWEQRIKRRHEGAVKPYDFRRTYANWLEAAGIPRTRRKLYLGHRSGDVTDMYEWHEVDEFLAADAAKLVAYLGSNGRQKEKPMPRNNIPLADMPDDTSPEMEP